MQQAITGMHSSFLTRWTRNPREERDLPIVVGCPDWPVAKRDKKSLTEIITNDGMHYHGILLVPPSRSRLQVPVEEHFKMKQQVYLGPTIDRIDVRPFAADDSDRVTDYALKGLRTGRLPGHESILILPRAWGERSARPYRPQD
jgi:hypothetical protein